MNRRDIQLDILKGIGIILVVFAHTAQNCASGFVYLFHMPLFFFLSGAALSFSKDMDYHFGKKLYRIMVPYVAFRCSVSSIGSLWSRGLGPSMMVTSSRC